MLESAQGCSEKETPAVAAEMPTIKLGSLKVSRLILGSNPFWGYAHLPGKVAEEMKAYYTDERIMAVLDEAAAHGITAVASPPEQRWLQLFAKYRGTGGKLRIWIAQPHGKPEQMKDEITRAVQGGAQAVFIQGGRADEQFAQGRMDVLREWVAHIRSLGVPAGMAAHNPDLHLEAEKQGFPTDFYFQCCYRPDKYLEEDRAKAIETIRKIEKPVVAYKILAAGRLSAAAGFGFAFQHIRRKDGVCVGVYPKDRPDEIGDDAQLARTLTAQ
ncbi:MAG: hypothetical protein ABSE73_24380 [Planctomycetota bacterium]